MDPELARLAATVEALTASLARVEERLTQLERAAPARIASAPPSAPLVAASRAPEPDLRQWVALVGRSSIVLGGAFLLRAVTDAHLYPTALGALAGLIYAGVLAWLADRAAARGAAASSAFHGATALAVALPLVDEMVVRFELLGAGVSALLLALIAGAALFIAHRRRQVALAWIATGATAITIMVLVVQTREMAPYLWVLAGLVAAASWLAPRLGQRFLIAPAALLGCLLALVLGQLVLVGRSAGSPGAALAALLAFFLLSTGGALLTMRTPSFVEMAEAGLVMACVLGQGARIALDVGGRGWFGASVLVASLAGLVLSFRARAFWSSFFVAAGLVALAVLADGAPLALFELGAAVLLFALARRYAQPLGELQAVAALYFAASASGLWSFALGALTDAPHELGPPAVVALAVLAASLGAAVVLVDAPPGAPFLQRLARPAALSLLLVSGAGVTAWAAISLLSAEAALAATLRTAVLSCGAVAVALASRRVAGARPLVYPLLLLGGAKLALEDFRVGSAGALFVALAVYGLALIVAPRLRSGARNL